MDHRHRKGRDGRPDSSSWRTPRRVLPTNRPEIVEEMGEKGMREGGRDEDSASQTPVGHKLKLLNRASFE